MLWLRVRIECIVGVGSSTYFNPVITRLQEFSVRRYRPVMSDRSYSATSESSASPTALSVTRQPPPPLSVRAPSPPLLTSSPFVSKSAFRVAPLARLDRSSRR
ncbi:hypothetical protein K443DRAFT_675176 [Laccaria amethystina LaAM-08-1]|uniref:Unplaced genomic scaffold K443scaffold_25, whole genome shotgun sequence n=1 Tax=Laccaria amethystina LaAM-08-1 TaxID=1095629 RepID=A0A0C9XK15_9AGAR|nr:hypothetical protein K443DRAFT_675176 [Laccaria amethystina LaAM-08-1]